MAVYTVRRIDEAYKNDDRDSISSIKLMGGPENIECPTFWIHPEHHFQELADRWLEETQYVSSLHEIIKHKDYQAIITMGRAAVPLLLKELEKPDPDHWGPALSAITGEQPVPAEAAGRLDGIAAAWLSWARKRGYPSG